MGFEGNFKNKINRYIKFNVKSIRFEIFQLFFKNEKFIKTQKKFKKNRKFFVSDYKMMNIKNSFFIKQRVTKINQKWFSNCL